MNTTQNRARKKIPALAAMALMTALTGSLLPASASADSPRTPAALPAIPASKVAPAAPTAVFNKLAAAGDVKGMWGLIEAQASSASQTTLTVWLRRLEAVQNKRLASLEEELSTEKVQDALMQADLYENADWTRGARTGVAQADALLDEITGQGYVLDTTEGYYFPKIDYERYLKYAKRVVPRYAQYLNLRVDDTRSEMTKDAGLIISWQEMLDRADRQSLYLQRYPNTPETKAIEEMYRQSLYIALYGTDNVQLFDYETHVMDYQARKAYQQYLALKSQTPFSQTLRGYMKILEKSGFKLSKSAEAFRDARNPWLAE